MKDALFIKEGITNDQIHQLLGYIAHDEAVKAFTRDATRFTNHQVTTEWFQNAYKVFTLTDELSELLGLIWYQAGALPDREYLVNFDYSKYNYTNAIRLYGRARGKGLAQWFLEETYKRIGEPPVWAEISNDNTASIRSHEKMNFRKVTDPNENGKIIMILP